MNKRPYVTMPRHGAFSFISLEIGSTLDEAIEHYRVKMTKGPHSMRQQAFIWFFATNSEHMFARYVYTKELPPAMAEALGLILVKGPVPLITGDVIPLRPGIVR